MSSSATSLDHHGLPALRYQMDPLLDLPPPKHRERERERERSRSRSPVFRHLDRDRSPEPRSRSRSRSRSPRRDGGGPHRYLMAAVEGDDVLSLGGNAEAGEANGVEDIVPVPLITPWWESDDPDEKTDTPDWCFMCSHVNDTTSNTTSSNFRKFASIITDLYETMGEKAYYHTIQQSYNTLIRPDLAPEFRDRPWLRRSIYDHLHHHRPLELVELYEDFHALRALSNHFKQHALLERLPGQERVQVNTRNLNIFLKLLDYRKKIHLSISDLRSKAKSQQSRRRV